MSNKKHLPSSEEYLNLFSALLEMWVKDLTENRESTENVSMFINGAMTMTLSLWTRLNGLSKQEVKSLAQLYVNRANAIAFKYSPNVSRKKKTILQ